MASFTDTQIPRFNPYIQQMPVEQMAQVGMAKQQQYDQGVQKIQTQIDNIAGMDVIRDVDKQYLQSKLNELGTKLKTVGAGDFSNYQLVNSTAGMTTHIAKDPNVINAVYSTANHKKQIGIIQDAKTKSESAPENEVDYQKQFGQYMNSDKVGELFNGQYTPYINVNKKIFEIGKEVGLDESTVQQLFKTDEKGNPLINKDGVLEFNPVMVERHLKGKDPEKLLAAFQNSLTPADYNQLSITGRYMKSNLSPDQLQKEVITNYTQNISQTNGKITEIELDLNKENSKNNKNQEVIESLNKQLDYFKNLKQNLESSRDRDAAIALSNPDAVRGSLYTNNYLSTMSKTLASSTKELLNKINPEFEVSMKINEFNRSIQRDKIADYHWSIEQEQKMKDRQWEKEKFQIELNSKYGIGQPGVNRPVDIPTNKFAIISTVEDDFSANTSDLIAANKLLTLAIFKKAKPKNSSETTYEYENRINKDMDDYIISQGIVNPKDKEAFYAEQASKQINQWTRDSNAIPSEFRDIVKRQRDLMLTLDTQRIDMEDIKKTAILKAKEQGLNYSSYEEIKNKITEINLPIGKGIAKDIVRLSKEDVLNFTKLHPELHNTFANFTVDDQQKKDRDGAKEKLLAKYGAKKLKDIENRLYVIESITDGLLPITDVSIAIHPEIEKTARSLSDINYGKIAEIEAQEYINRGYLKQPKAFAVVRGTENQQDVNSKIINIIKANPKTGFSGVDPEDLIKAVLSGKDDAVTLVATPGISSRQDINYIMEVTTSDGKTIPIKITSDNFSYLSKQPSMVSQDEPDVLKHLDTNGTTGRGGSDDPGSAWFSEDQFVNVKNQKYKVTGNLISSVGNPNKIIFRLYIQEPGKRVEVLDYDEGIPRMNADGSFNQTLTNLAVGVTPSMIEQLRKIK